MAVEVCIIKSFDLYRRWWIEDAKGYQLYLGIVFLFFSLVIGRPLAEASLLLLRYAVPEGSSLYARCIYIYIYIYAVCAHIIIPYICLQRTREDLRCMLLWEFTWLFRIGLFCVALQIVGLTTILCQWPLWIFGFPLLLWINAVGNVLREVIVRRGTVKTLLHEGMTVCANIALSIYKYRAHSYAYSLSVHDISMHLYAIIWNALSNFFALFFSRSSKHSSLCRFSI